MKDSKEMSYVKRGLGYLGNQFMRYFGLIMVVLLFQIIDSVTYTFVPLFIQYIIAVLTGETGPINLPNRLIEFFNSGSTKYQMIVYAGLGLAVYQILRGLLKIVSSITRQLLGENLTKNMRYQLYHHIQKLPYSYHINSDTGELIHRCTNDIDVVRNFVCNQMPEVISIFAILISCVYQMSKINSSLTLVSLIIVPVAFISSFIFCRYVAKKFEQIECSEDELTSIIQENIENVRVVKACSNELYEIDRFTKKNQEYARKNYQLNLASAYFWGFSDMTTLLQYLLTCVVAIYLVKNNNGVIGIAAFSTMMSLVSSYIWPVRSLGRIIGDTGKSSVSAGRIKEILEIKDEYSIDKGTVKEIKGQIEFQNVSFHFSDTDQHLLKNINFLIKPGETVSFIGRTGSGKSTIAKLLTRMLDSNEGKILIDNNEIKTIEKKHLRKNVGLILQEPFLYAKTVYENIAITNKVKSSEKVREVAKISAIDRDINSFEKGYETMVGEKGVTLSGGQKQRVAIARMLLEEKPIIIFDDSLSAVDTETDRLIRNALQEKTNKSTLIIITHRISTARYSDKIIVLENGGIGAIGTHDELIKQDGVYQKLWNIQGNIEEEFMNILNKEEVDA